MTIVTRYFNIVTSILIIIGSVFDLSTNFYYFQRVLISLSLSGGIYYCVLKVVNNAEVKKISTIVGIVAFVLLLLYNPVIPFYFYYKYKWIVVNIFYIIVTWFIELRIITSSFMGEKINTNKAFYSNEAMIIGFITLLIVSVDIAYFRSGLLPEWFGIVSAVFFSIATIFFRIFDNYKVELFYKGGRKIKKTTFPGIALLHIIPIYLLFFVVRDSENVNFGDSLNPNIFAIIYTVYFLTSFDYKATSDLEYDILLNKNESENSNEL